MVTHIVFWNLKEEFKGDKKEESVSRIRTALEALPEKIDGLISAEVGENYNPKGCDLSLYTQLESKEALEAYQTNPEHIKAATIVRSMISERWVVDYEK